MIECPPCLVGIDQIPGNGARMFDRMRDGLRGDFGEHYPVQGLVLEQALLGQDLADMPGDGLALTIWIGSQIDGTGVLGGLGDGIHVLLVLFLHLVAHGEVVIDIDRAVLARQIADMAVRGQDQEVLAEVFIDRFGFRRRFNNQ